MIRGTTPTFEFTLPMLTDEISAGYITFAQDGSVVIDKALPAVTAADNGKILKVVNGAWQAVSPD